MQVWEFESMVTLGIRLEPYVDYYSHVYQIIYNKKNLNIRNIFLSHLQSFFSEWTYGILARESGSLHVQSVVDKRCKYKYEVIGILAISAITSKHKVSIWPNYGKAFRAKCVFIACKVTGLSAVWNFHNQSATFAWLRPAS